MVREEVIKKTSNSASFRCFASSSFKEKILLINPCSLFKSIAFVLSTQILIEKIEVNKFKSTGKDFVYFFH